MTLTRAQKEVIREMREGVILDFDISELGECCNFRLVDGEVIKFVEMFGLLHEKIIVVKRGSFTLTETGKTIEL